MAIPCIENATGCFDIATAEPQDIYGAGALAGVDADGNPAAYGAPEDPKTIELGGDITGTMQGTKVRAGLTLPNPNALTFTRNRIDSEQYDGSTELKIDLSDLSGYDYVVRTQEDLDALANSATDFVPRSVLVTTNNLLIGNVIPIYGRFTIAPGVTVQMGENGLIQADFSRDIDQGDMLIPREVVGGTFIFVEQPSAQFHFTGVDIYGVTFDLYGTDEFIADQFGMIKDCKVTSHTDFDSGLRSKVWFENGHSILNLMVDCPRDTSGNPAVGSFSVCGFPIATQVSRVEGTRFFSNNYNIGVQVFDTCFLMKNNVLRALDFTVKHFPSAFVGCFADTQGSVIAQNTPSGGFNDDGTPFTQDAVDFNELANRPNIAGMNAATAAVQDRVDTLEERSDTADARIAQAESDITALDGRMDAAENNITSTESSLDALEMTVGAVQGTLTDTTTLANTTKSQADEIRTDLSTAEDNIASVTDRVTAAESEIAVNSNDITANTSAISAEVTRATAAEADISTALAGLPTKEYVDSSISNMAARRITYNAAGAVFPTSASLTSATTVYYDGEAVTPLEHDVATVSADETAPAPYNGGQTEYEYSGTIWVYIRGINERPFTAAETAALASGITSLKVAQIDLKAPISSPDLTGTPTAPTAPTATNSTQIATTAFVQGVKSSLATVARTGKYSDLTELPTIPGMPDTSGLAPLASPALTGIPTAPTASAGTNSTQIATTAFAQSLKVSPSNLLPAMDLTAEIGTSNLFSRADHRHPSDTSRLLVTDAAAKYAPLISPALIGTPTAPTAPAGTNSTQLATTAYVQSAFKKGSSPIGATGPFPNTISLSDYLKNNADGTWTLPFFGYKESRYDGAAIGAIQIFNLIGVSLGNMPEHITIQGLWTLVNMGAGGYFMFTVNFRIVGVADTVTLSTGQIQFTGNRAILFSIPCTLNSGQYVPDVINLNYL